MRQVSASSSGLDQPARRFGLRDGAVPGGQPRRCRVASSSGSRATHGRLRFAVTAAILAALSLGPGENEAEAYRFYDNGARDYVVGSDDALRWSADVWGPGDTLVWRIEDGPDWARLWESVSEVTPLVEAPLSAWSGIETADISWRLEGVRDPPESRFGDSRNAVYLDTWSDIVGAAHWWVRDDADGRWEMTECDVGLPWHWWLDENLERRDDSLDAEGLPRWTTDFLAEELGHCLGLGNTGSFPGSPRVRRSSIRDEDGSDDAVWRHTAVWAPSPTMGSGRPPLALDDRVGASLARPRAGWGASVGSVAGILESEGERVRYAYVWAVRRLPSGAMRNPVGAFSNDRGEFFIEGLEAGQYILWAKPIRDRRWHRRLIANDATTDVKDSVLAFPVRVAAGRTTGGIAIPLTRSRE